MVEISVPDAERIAKMLEEATADAGMTTGPVGTGTVLTSIGILAFLFVLTVPPVAMLSVGIGAGLFVGSFSLLERRRWFSVRNGIAAFLAAIVGAAFTGAIGFTLVELVGSVYPVSDVPTLKERGLEIVSATLVLVAGSIGVIGGLATVTTGFREETVRRYRAATGNATVVLFLLTVVLGGLALLEYGKPLERTLAGEVVAQWMQVIVAPVGGRAHVLIFTAILFGTVLACERAIVAVLSTEVGGPQANAFRNGLTSIRPAARRLRQIVTLVLLLSLLGIRLSPADLYSTLRWPLYSVLQGLTSSRVLREVLVAVFLLGTVTVMLVRVYRASVTVRRIDRARTVLPIVASLTIGILAAVLHGILLDVIASWMATRLPGPFAAEFEVNFSALEAFWGPLTLSMGIATIWSGLAWLLARSVSSLLTTRPLRGSLVAPALSASGTFLAAVFAAGARVHPVVVMLGLLAGMLVWDVMKYEETLAREVGSRALENRTPIVHGLGSVFVGVLGSIGALIAFAIGPTPSVVPSETLPFAIVAVIIGIVLLLMSLR